MAKDRYWFKHDLNARSDDKILAMIADYGAVGYGLYWCIVERLHEEDNHIEINERFCNTVGKPLRVKPEKVMDFIDSCIDQYELFTRNKGILSAKRVKSNLEDRKALSQKRSIAGKNGVKVKQSQANVKQKQAIAKQTEAIAQQKQAEERRREEKRGDSRKEEPDGLVKWVDKIKSDPLLKQKFGRFGYPPEEFSNACDDFDIEAIPKDHPNFEEYRKHFGNWISFYHKTIETKGKIKSLKTESSSNGLSGTLRNINHLT